MSEAEGGPAAWHGATTASGEAAELEGLADEIQQRAEGESAAALPPVERCWEAAFDRNSQSWYWFNRALGTSQWHPPPGWSAPPARTSSAQHLWTSWPEQAPAAAADAAAAAAHPLPTDPGYYYKDAYGVEQGPFTAEQLLQWRELLPMDLPVLHVAARLEPLAEPAAAESAAAGAVAATQEEQPAEAAASPGGGAELARQGVPGEGAAGGGGACPEAQQAQQEEAELASVLGDSELLEQWRQRNPEQVGALRGACR